MVEAMTKALLIHVGADQSKSITLGVNAPIFEDGTFEFIPIPECYPDGTCIVKKDRNYVVMREGEEQKEKVWTTERRTYSTIETRYKIHGKTLSDYLSREYDHVVVHFDPDFNHYTYGDRIDTPKGGQIWVLKRDDYIFFVASLAPYLKEAYEIRSTNRIRSYQRYRMAKFVIGYFKVQEIYNAIKTFDEPIPLLYVDENDAEPVNESLDQDTLRRITQNAHTKCEENIYYIVVGDQSDSAFLTKAVRLTERGFPFRPSRIGREIFGDVCYPRGVKWIKSQNRIKILLNYVRNNV